MLTIIIIYRFLPLLRAMTPIIHSSLSYLLLEVTTRVLVLLNKLLGQRGGGNGGGNGLVPATASSVGNTLPTLNDPPAIGTVKYIEENRMEQGRLARNVVDDSLICGILGRAPTQDFEKNEVFYTTMGIIEKCLLIAGEESRIALARFFPYYCLTDESVRVRRMALDIIAQHPDLVMKYANEIMLR